MLLVFVGLYEEIYKYMRLHYISMVLCDTYCLVLPYTVAILYAGGWSSRIHTRLIREVSGGIDRPTTSLA